MKALINGINVEGTPQEIAEYQRTVGVYVAPTITVKCDWDVRKVSDSLRIGLRKGYAF